MEEIQSNLPLSESACCALKNAIVKLELKPGEPLSETQLISMLGMSRTPIRQALARLEQQGLVELIPKRGWFVTDVSIRDIQEIFVIREALEGISARLAAAALTDDELTALSEYMKAREKQGDIDKDPGDRIHEVIMAAVDNRQVNKVLNQYEDHLKRIHHLALMLPGRAHQSFVEHRSILAALVDRNGELAESEMRDHVRSSGKSLLDSIVAGKVKW